MWTSVRGCLTPVKMAINKITYKTRCSFTKPSVRPQLVLLLLLAGLLRMRHIFVLLQGLLLLTLFHVILAEVVVCDENTDVTVKLLFKIKFS